MGWTRDHVTRTWPRGMVVWRRRAFQCGHDLLAIDVLAIHPLLSPGGRKGMDHAVSTGTASYNTSHFTGNDQLLYATVSK